MATAEQIVDAFIAAIGRKDVDAALELVADDLEYDNVPMPTIHGKEDTRAFLGPFVTGSDEVEFVVHRQVADGDTVFNERTDRFRSGDKVIEIKVVGVWVVRDGLISLWRDYFDLQSFTDQMA
jgi:limonene-1,2-epoxide hydrolase